MTTDVQSVVTEYVEACGNRDYERVERLIHGDATVGGVVPRELKGRSEFVTALQRLAPVIVRNEVKRVFVDGEEAAVFYDLVTDTPAGAVLSVEWLTVRNGLIRSSVLLFDQRRWPDVVSKLQRKT